MPLRPGGGRIAVDLGREFRALQLERLEFAIDRLVERGRRPCRAPCDSACGRRAVGGLGLHGGGLQRLEPVLAGIDQGDVGIVLARQRCEIVDRRHCICGRRAQREQPLLDALELGRIEIGGRARPLRDGRASPPTR